MEEIKSAVEALNKTFNEYKSDVLLKDSEYKADQKAKSEKMAADIVALQTTISDWQLKQQLPFVGEQKSSENKEVFFKGFLSSIDTKGRINLTEREKNLFDEIQKKSLNLQIGSDGGYLAPSELLAEIERDLVLLSPIRNLATVNPTTKSRVEATVKTGTNTATWGKQIPAAVNGTYGKKTYHSQKLLSYTIIDDDMLDDVPYVMSEVEADFQEEFIRGENLAFLTGDGIEKPYGILNNNEIETVTASSNSAISYAKLVEFHTKILASGYNAKIMINPLSLALLLNIVDGSQRPIFSLSMNAAVPMSLWGVEIILNPDMPVAGSNAKVLIGGDFKSGYRIIDRKLLTFERKDPASTTDIGLLAKRRVGGDVKRASALKILKLAA